MGRKPKLTHHQQQEAIKRLNSGKETQGDDFAAHVLTLEKSISRARD